MRKHEEQEEDKEREGEDIKEEEDKEEEGKRGSKYNWTCWLGYSTEN